MLKRSRWPEFILVLMAGLAYVVAPFGISDGRTVPVRAENHDLVTDSLNTRIQLPRMYLDTTYLAPKGATISVTVRDLLQAALNRAKCGDVVTLAAGATFQGNFVLPNKGACNDWIIIRSDALDAGLPPAGSRVNPSSANSMPKLLSNNAEPTIAAAPGANHYRFIGVEIGVTDSVNLNFEIFRIGQSEKTASELPHDIIIDRCYLHGTSKAAVKHGLVFNGASLAVVDSYISDIHVAGQDTQAIIGWNGPGPFKIVNNHLEAAGENVMFGGARPALVNNIPSDIEIRGNHFFKPVSWMVGNPSYAGTHWSVKNLLEFKNAQRVLVTGNILENNWVDGQTGFALQITPRTEDGKAPWIYVQDITFTYNIVRHTASGINISGLDSGDPEKTVRGRRILIQNNLLYDVDGKTWGGGNGRLFQILSGADTVTIDHNTAFQSNQIIFADGIPSTNFVYQNNIAPHNMYGVMGSGAAPGNSSLNRYFPDAIFQKNVLVSTGASRASYPGGNFYASDWAAVRFVDFANGNYALAPSSQYKKEGTDGEDIGADIAAIKAKTSSVLQP